MMARRIKKEMLIMPLSEIVPYENNPRLNDGAVDAVAASIRQTGNLDPIEVDEDNVILSGHTRLRALQKLGYEKTEVVRYIGLSKAAKRKYRILTNKTGELADWDVDKLRVELKGLDFGDYDFGLDLPDLADEPEEDDGYYGDERERTYNAVNLYQFDERRCDGFYQMPILRPCGVVPDHLIGFNYAKGSDDADAGVHFFIDDYQFERIWNDPAENIERLKKFKCVFTPDFSLYMDMPMAMKVWDVYRSRVIGQMMQDAGISVIPTLSWAQPETYQFCFDGIMPGGLIAVSTVGVARDAAARAVFADGMDEAIRRLKPKMVLCYGAQIGYDFGKMPVKYYEARKFVEGS